MDFACSLCLDSEQAEYLGEQAIWVSFKMRGKLRKNPEHQIKLIFRHRLDDKFAIMAEKEEAAATAGALASFEDLVTIGTRAQAFLNY